MACTLIKEDLRREAAELAAAHGIPFIDLFGPVIDCFARVLGMQPTQEYSSYERSDQNYFSFCRAVEYALEHDDGANPSGWVHADVVILGLSRVGKSPLSVYMSTLGLKVANYPLCPGVELPDELSKVDRRRVFGLLVDAEVLVQYRRARSKRLGTVAKGYDDASTIYEEIEQVKEILKKKRFTAVDATGMSVASISSKIMRYLAERFGELNLDDPFKPVKKYTSISAELDELA